MFKICLLSADDTSFPTTVEFSEVSEVDSSVSSTECDSSFDSSYASVSSQLETIHNDLQHIGQGVDHIFACGLLLIVFLGVWTILNKWYFGGV